MAPSLLGTCLDDFSSGKAGGEPSRLQLGPSGCSVCCLKSKIDRTAGWDGCAWASPGKVQGLGLALGGQVLKLEVNGRNSRQRIKAGCQPMRVQLPESTLGKNLEWPLSALKLFLFKVDSTLERLGNGWGGDQGVQSCSLTDFSNPVDHFYFLCSSILGLPGFIFIFGGRHAGVCVCVCTISCQISVLLLSSTCNHTHRYCLYLHLSRDSTPCFPSPCPCSEGLLGKTVSPLPARRSPGLFPPS